MNAVDYLRREHQGVLLMLDILEEISSRLERGKRVNPSHLEKILDFFRVFVDRCHHSKEEDLLLPVVADVQTAEEKKLAADILKEHQKSREYIHKITQALVSYKKKDKVAAYDIAQNVRRYIELLREHIGREDNVLFLEVEKKVSSQKQDELYEGFEQIEKEKIGPGRHEKFHQLIERLKKIYLGK